MLKYGNTIIDHSDFEPRSKKKRIASLLLIVIGILFLIWTIGCGLISVAVHFGEINPGKGAFLGDLIFTSPGKIGATLIAEILLIATGTIIALRNE